MRNARISFILWLLFPLLAAAQLPPLTRSVLTTNIPAFGSAGQALFRISIPPYLNWSNIVSGLSITDSNNIINLASNYTWAVSNYAWTAASGLTNELTTVSNAAINASSNYTYAVSNLVVASTNGQFIEKTGGVGTNTTIYQVNRTGNALTIGTNSGAVFSIMGVTNGPSPYLVQIGSPMLSADSGGTNTMLISTNGGVAFNGSTIQPNALTAPVGYISTVFVGTGTLVPSFSQKQTLSLKVGSTSLETNFIYFNNQDATNLMFCISNRPTPRFSVINSAWHTNSPLANSVMFGIGTNDPKSSLHIVGGATTNENALRVDTTNNYGLLSLTTNGVLTVKSNVVVQGGLISTNDFVYQRDQTGPALTIGTNAGAVFSIMGVTNGPGWAPLVQIGAGANGIAANSGGTNMLVGLTNGRIGISVSTPLAKLHVGTSSGDASMSSIARFANSSSGGEAEGLTIWNTATLANSNAACVSFSTGDGIGSIAKVGAIAEGTAGVKTALYFNTFGTPAAITERMHIDGSGNIGISTNVPFARLQVYSPIWSTNEYSLLVGQTNNYSILSLTTNGVLTVKSNLILSSVRWVDSPVQLNWSATGPSAPPAVSVAAGSQILAPGFTVAGIGTEKVYGQFQINHNVCASNATVYTEHHLHVSPTNAPSAGSSNIAFTIVYDWANISGTRFGPYTNTVQIGLTAQTYNNLIEMGHQTNFFPTISAISRCTIYRSAAASNEYNHTVILDGADVHYPIDRLGSASDTAP